MKNEKAKTWQLILFPFNRSSRYIIPSTRPQDNLITA